METPMRWRELFQQGRGKLTTGILLVEFMVAVEALVIIAIMPAIRRDLGGPEVYGLGRARVLALLAGAWIVPGLLGPSFGALMASTLGWRWAFVSIIPLTVIAMALTLPALHAVPAAERPSQLSTRWPLSLAVGVAALISGLSLLSWLSVPLVAVGSWLTWSALGHILPAGSLRARPGPPAAIMTIFLLLIAFVGADY